MLHDRAPQGLLHNTGSHLRIKLTVLQPKPQQQGCVKNHRGLLLSALPEEHGA